MSGGFDDFFSGMSLLQKNKKILIKFSFLTVISWFIVFLQYWFLSIALGLGLTYLLIFIILSVVTLTEILPISFSGIGTRDVAMILLFSFVNIHPANAVAFSIAMLLVIYIHGFFGMIFFIKNPIKLFNKSELKMSTVHT